MFIAQFGLGDTYQSPVWRRLGEAARHDEIGRGDPAREGMKGDPADEVWEEMAACELLLMATSGLFESVPRTSAFPPKPDIGSRAKESPDRSRGS